MVNCPKWTHPLITSACREKDRLTKELEALKLSPEEHWERYLAIHEQTKQRIVNILLGYSN